MLDPHNLTPKTSVEERVKQTEVVRQFSMSVPTGAKVFECNPETLDVNEVKRHYSQIETGLSGMKEIHHKSDANDTMVYILAINKKNAIRKLKRML